MRLCRFSTVNMQMRQVPPVEHHPAYEPRRCNRQERDAYFRRSYLALTALDGPVISPYSSDHEEALTKVLRRRAIRSRPAGSPEMKLVKDLPQRKPGRTVIAHISDLHFHADTRTDDWILQALQNSLAATKPDLLFVTCHLINSSIRDTAASAVQAALAKSRAYVE